MELKMVIRRRNAMITLIGLLMIFIPLTIALAEASEPKNAGTGSDVLKDSTTQVWQNPNNITAPIGFPYSTVTLNKDGHDSHYLQATHYGFTIPTGATISGIMVAINRQASGRNPSIYDNEVRLVKAGIVSGDDKKSTTVWPTTMTTMNYGGSTDLWGTSWTPAEINANDFGVVLAVYRQSNGNNDRIASVDFIQVTVYYTNASGTSVDCGNGTPVVVYGGSIPCEAIVTAGAGSGTPTGTVSWTTDAAGTFNAATCNLSGSGGTAKCSVSYTPDAVGSGIQVITATYAGDANFKTSSGTRNLTVYKADPACMMTPYDITYDGNPHTASGACTGVKAEALPGLDLSGTTHTNAGDYPGDTWTFTDATGNYNNSTGQIHDRISKAEANCVVVPYDVFYDGKPHTATGTCTGVKGEVLGGLDLTGTTHTLVGTYTDHWTFTDGSGNYNNTSGTISDVIRLKMYLPLIFR